MEGIGFLLKINSLKFCSCTYWSKCRLVYIVMSCAGPHVNWSPWFKMLNLLDCLSVSFPFSLIYHFFTLFAKVSCLFPSFFLFALKFPVVNWARWGCPTARQGERRTPSHTLFLTIYFLDFLDALCCCCLFLVYHFSVFDHCCWVLFYHQR